MIKKIENRVKVILNKRKAARQRKGIGTTVKWGIMGLGNMGDYFASALECIPEAELIAVGSRDKKKAESFGKKHAVKHCYGTYEELLSDPEIQIIYIATPHFCHYRNVKMCFEYGKNVLCEKPLVQSTAELDELVKMAQEKNLFFMEAMWTKCLPTVDKLKEWMRSETIGELQYIRIDLSKHEIVDPKRDIYDPEKGGVLWDYGVYPIMLACDILDGDLVLKTCICHRDYQGLERSRMIVLSNGKQDAVITMSSEFEESKKAGIFGKKGSIQFSAPFNRTNKINLFDITGKCVQSFEVKYIYDGFEYEIKEVNKCIQNKKIQSDKVPHNFSKRVLKVMELIAKEG